MMEQAVGNRCKSLKMSSGKYQHLLPLESRFQSLLMWKRCSFRMENGKWQISAVEDEGRNEAWWISWEPLDLGSMLISSKDGL